MDIYHRLEEIDKIHSSVLTIGTFDGIHCGHQEIILRTVSEAKKNNCSSILITFDPHPQHILRSANHVKKEIITPIDKKIQLVKELGVDIMILLPFDLQMASVSAEDFLKNVILDKFNPVKIIIGHDHHFGNNREGNDKFLLEKSKKYLFELDVVPAVCDGNNTISSTAIRLAVKTRNLDLVRRYLGRDYELTGIVIKGVGRGQKLNFPTANLRIIDNTILQPPVGVYCVQVIIENKVFRGACNIGFRPTFDDGLTHPVIEVNIFENSIENLYGKIIKLKFLKFVRNEQKFESSDQLVKQLIFDREFCLNLHDK
ncbi:MAG: bifunctional riboflavin kinase/FAD synthetase [Candidatus Marinimicrobia bacterium]|nr:bifunctional riboflavin kinase/FAD synthetase [Candidatus Neomarinimicrobiota bacterium]